MVILGGSPNDRIVILGCRSLGCDSRRQVYLAGLLHPVDLAERLRTAPLIIELHDRDRRDRARVFNA
jgi:hypothetical protein